jgi:hypothetical protein
MRRGIGHSPHFEDDRLCLGVPNRDDLVDFLLGRWKEVRKCQAAAVNVMEE